MLLPILLSLSTFSSPGRPAQDSLPALHTLKDEDIDSVTSRHEDQTLTVKLKNGTVYLYHHKDWDLEDKNPGTADKIKATMKDIDQIVFTKAEHMPEFPGGDDAYQRYIQTFCATHKDDIASTGPAEMTVQFTVHLKGQLTNIEVIFGPQNAKQRALAIQAIRESPSWIPALQNGHNVVCYKKVRVFLQ